VNRDPGAVQFSAFACALVSKLNKLDLPTQYIVRDNIEQHSSPEKQEAHKWITKKQQVSLKIYSTQTKRIRDQATTEKNKRMTKRASFSSRNEEIRFWRPTDPPLSVLHKQNILICNTLMGETIEAQEGQGGREYEERTRGGESRDRKEGTVHSPRPTEATAIPPIIHDKMSSP